MDLVSSYRGDVSGPLAHSMLHSESLKNDAARPITNHLWAQCDVRADGSIPFITREVNGTLSPTLPIAQKDQASSLPIPRAEQDL